MKVSGIEGDYKWVHPHFAVWTYQHGKPILSAKKKKEILQESELFKTKYTNWYSSASKQLSVALENGKITEKQYTVFLERQKSNSTAIHAICSCALTGEIYFDFNSFEKEHMGAYETRQVFMEFSKIKFYIQSNENLAKIFPANKATYTAKLPYFSVAELSGARPTLNWIEQEDVQYNAERFRDNYENWFDNACLKLQQDFKDGKITELAYNLFFERQTLIRKTIINLAALALTGEIQFDFLGFEKENIGVYETSETYIKFLKITDFIKSVKRWEPFVINTPIKVSAFFEITDDKSKAKNVNPIIRSRLLADHINFKINYNAWYCDTQTKKQEAFHKGLISESAYTAFLQRQSEIATALKQLSDSNYIAEGKAYFDGRCFEKKYLPDYDCKEVCLVFLKIKTSL